MNTDGRDYCDRLRGWAERSVTLGEDDRKMTWHITGELDSPIARETWEAIHSRPKKAVGQLLGADVRHGRSLIFVQRGSTDWTAALVGCLARKYLHEEGPMPVWLRCWGVDMRRSPEEILAEYAGRPNHDRCGSIGTIIDKRPRVMVLERPELSMYGAARIDGMVARDIVEGWHNQFQDDTVVAVVGSTSFIARDPYPGHILVRLSGSDQPIDRFDNLGFCPRGSIPDALVSEAIEEVASGRSGGASAFVVMRRLLAMEVSGYSHDESFFSERQLGELRPHCAQLVGWLRRLVSDPLGVCGTSKQDGEGRQEPNCSDAVVSARLYVLLDSLFPQGLMKRTFVGLDLGRWLCFLRAHSYELLAAVTSRLGRETLGDQNLVHAPTMEFASLAGADCSGGDFYRANLAYADLRGVSFVGADLSRSHLKGADLRGANLRGADVSYSSLELADLRGARIDDANLSHCFREHMIS